MNQNRIQNPLLLGFILFSLLLHLLLIYLVPELSLFPVPPKKDRVVVEMRPEPEMSPRERELDLTPKPELDKPRTKPAKRLAAANQVVEKETAPKGTSPDDMRPDSAAPQASVSHPQQTAPPPQPQTRQPSQSESANGISRAVKPQEETPPNTTPVLPDLKSLVQLPVNTQARLAPEWRQKERPDVQEGDTVWLDTEQDLLFSFFQRLRNGIYNVWTYPAQAARRGETGTCLVQMTFNRKGELTRPPELLQTSGYPELDREALAAIRKGSPYGPLSKAYAKDHLTVKAYFNYNLTGSGSLKHPGRIHGPQE